MLTGKLHLPDVVAHLGRHLNYGWAFMLDLPGANSRIMGRHIVQTWKPILAYTPGTWPAGQWGHDRVVSPRPDQSQHAWAQNAEPMRELIRRYTRPNAIILDPFCGSGAYGCAALLEGRRFIGIDIHADADEFVPKRQQFGPRKTQTIYASVLLGPLHARFDDWGGVTTWLWTALLRDCSEERARDAYDVVLAALLTTDAKGRDATLVLERADLILAESLGNVRNGERLDGAVR